MSDNFVANEFSKKPTANYKAHIKAIQELSVIDIIRAVDYINLLTQFIDGNNEVLDDIGDVLEPLSTVIKKLSTPKKCGHCGELLYKSDLPQYGYVCFDCDENF